MEPRLATRTLSASTEIAKAALSSDDPAAMLRVIVQSAAELAEADLGLLMVSSADGTLTVEAAAGETPPYAADPVGIVLSARSSAARVARGGVPVAVDDFTTDPRTAPFVPKALRRYGPFAVAPFGTPDRRLGALAMYRRHGKKPFQDNTVDVLTAFAAQAAVVLVLAEGATARQHIAVYQEREHLAQDLHDVIVQRLYGTGMQLDLLQRKISGQLPEEHAKRLADAVDQLDATIDEVRATVKALRSADPLETEVPPLDETVQSEVRTAGELLGCSPTVNITGDTATIPPSTADHARAALREALSNVVRHSGARSLHVAVLADAKRLRLQVSDDGCGIPDGVARRGLRNLADRATAAGGRCVIDSSARNGTTVIWQVPRP